LKSISCLVFPNQGSTKHFWVFCNVLWHKIKLIWVLNEWTKREYRATVLILKFVGSASQKNLLKTTALAQTLRKRCLSRITEMRTKTFFSDLDLRVEFEALIWFQLDKKCSDSRLHWRKGIPVWVLHSGLIKPYLDLTLETARWLFLGHLKQVVFFEAVMKIGLKPQIKLLNQQTPCFAGQLNNSLWNVLFLRLKLLCGLNWPRMLLNYCPEMLFRWKNIFYNGH